MGTTGDRNAPWPADGHRVGKGRGKRSTVARYDAPTDAHAKRAIAALTASYDDPANHFVDRLAHGLERIAAVCHPAPAIVRMSDFKTHEYAHLPGGVAEVGKLQQIETQRLRA